MMGSDEREKNKDIGCEDKVKCENVCEKIIVETKSR